MQCIAAGSTGGHWQRAVDIIARWAPVFRLQETPEGVQTLEGSLHLRWCDLEAIDCNAPAHYRHLLQERNPQMRAPLEATAPLQTAILLSAGADFALQYALNSRHCYLENDFASKRLDLVLQQTCPADDLLRMLRVCPMGREPILRQIYGCLVEFPLEDKLAIERATRERCVSTYDEDFMHLWNTLKEEWEIGDSKLDARRFQEDKVKAYPVHRIDHITLSPAETHTLYLYHADVRLPAKSVRGSARSSSPPAQDFAFLALLFLFERREAACPRVWARARQCVKRNLSSLNDLRVAPSARGASRGRAQCVA